MVPAISLYRCSYSLRRRATVASEWEKVVGGDGGVLDHREVDLDLVQPGGVDRGVNEDQVRPAVLEAVDRRLPAVRGAVIDDPEHARGGGVGLPGHHLPDQSVDGFNSRPWVLI